MRLNPFYTKSEYYEPKIWESFTDSDGTLKAGRAFDPQLLYTWRCNLFAQENYYLSGTIDAMGLCFTDPTPAARDEFLDGLSSAEKKIAADFDASPWAKLDPAMHSYKDTSEDPPKEYSSAGHSTEETKLFSFVFNAFVFMQVFNQINARKLEAGEWNVFGGMLANMPFLGIMVATIAVQLLMVEFGGRFVKCWPLNAWQNFLCVLLGAGELPWGVLIKLVPTRYFPNLSL